METDKIKREFEHKFCADFTLEEFDEHQVTERRMEIRELFNWVIDTLT